MHHYAITVRKTRGKPRVSDYENWLAINIAKGYTFSDVNYEDTKGLHIHAIVTHTAPVEWSNLKTTKYGWNFKLVPIYHRTGWIKYSTKDAKKDVKRQAQLHEIWSEAPYPYSLSPAQAELGDDWAPVGEEEGNTKLPYDPNEDDNQSYQLCQRLKTCRIL